MAETPAQRIERFGAIHAYQSSEYLGRMLAEKEAIIERLVREHRIKGWCACGHMEQIHHDAGCTGLVNYYEVAESSEWYSLIGLDDWVPCRCLAFDRAPWSTEDPNTNQTPKEQDPWTTP